MSKIDRIKVYVSVDEYNNAKKYRMFDVVDEVPKVGDKDTSIYGSTTAAVVPIIPDCEQGNPEVDDYDYYRVTRLPNIIEEDEDIEDQYEYEYKAVKKAYE